MKVDKLFGVLVLGGGLMAGCGGQPAPMPSEESPAVAPADDAAEPAEGDAAGGPAGEAGADGESGKCAWY